SKKANSLARDPALHQQADRASSQASRDRAQVKQGAEAMRPEAQQPLEKERRRAEALANELARAQQVIETQVALASKARDQAAQRDLRTQGARASKAREEAVQLKPAEERATAALRQSVKTEHDRAEALTGELAKARRDFETQLALSKAGDEAAQVKKAAESAT